MRISEYNITMFVAIVRDFIKGKLSNEKILRIGQLYLAPWHEDYNLLGSAVSTMGTQRTENVKFVNGVLT